MKTLASFYPVNFKSFRIEWVVLSTVTEVILSTMGDVLQAMKAAQGRSKRLLS